MTLFKVEGDAVVAAEEESACFGSYADTPVGARLDPVATGM